MWNMDGLIRRRKLIFGISVVGLVWAYFRWRERSQEQRQRVFVLIQGAPALGKTTLSGPLAVRLNASGIKSIAIEQDTFAARGSRSSGKRFTKHLDKLMKSERFDVILSARNNATIDQYKHHLELAEKHGWSCVMLYPAYLDSDSSAVRNLFALMVLHSMYQRSQAVWQRKVEPHPTLKNLPLGRKFHICGNFLVRLRKPEDLPVIPVRWLRQEQHLNFSDEGILRNVESFLQHVRKMG